MGPRFIRAASDVLGYEVGDDQVADAVAAHEGKDISTLRQALLERTEAFEAAGGRGVELTEEIDSLRIALAVRGVKEQGKIRFQPGSVVATLGALQVATHEQIAGIVGRHLAGDWGDVSKDDAAANEKALKDGDRLVSSYEIAPDTKLYGITEWDRSATTVMTPGEY